MHPTEHQPQAPANTGRRHDLDALRGFAMLLGILLHAALAYLGIPWPGRDERKLGVRNTIIGKTLNATRSTHWPSIQP